MLIDTSNVSLRIRRSSFDGLASRPTSPAVSNIGVFCRSRPNSACDSVDLDSPTPTYCAQVESQYSFSSPKPLPSPSLYNNAMSTPNSIQLVDDDNKSLSLSMRTAASSSESSTRTLRRLPGRIVGQIENNNLRIERVPRNPVASKKNRHQAPPNVSADSQIITPVRPPVSPPVSTPPPIHKKTNPELERYQEYDPSAKRLPFVYRVVLAKNHISKALQRKSKPRPTPNPNSGSKSEPISPSPNAKQSKSPTASILRKPKPRAGTSISSKEPTGTHVKSINPTRIRKVTFSSISQSLLPNTVALTSSSRAIEHRPDRRRSVSFSGFASMSMGIVSPSAEEEDEDLDPATREATLVANNFVGLYSF